MKFRLFRFLFGKAPLLITRKVEGITKVFVDLGVPKEAVEIVIYESPKTNRTTDGQLIQKEMPVHPRYKPTKCTSFCTYHR
jgi:hypothetical protein